MEACIIVSVMIVVSCFASCLAQSSGVYVDNTLNQQTVLVHKIPSSQRRAIKQEILNLLGLEKKPRPSSSGTKYSAPHYMLDLYNTLEWRPLVDEDVEEEEVVVKRRLAGRNLTLPGMEVSVGRADMIMSFVHHFPKDSVKLRHQASRRYYFDFHEVPPEQGIIAAELRMFKTASTISNTYTISIYRIVQGHKKDERELELEVSTSVYSHYEGWIDLNVTNMATQWNYFPATNLGLYMKVIDSQGNDLDPRDVGFVGKKGRDDQQPFLVAFFKATQEVRVRRTRAASRKNRKSESSRAAMDDPWGNMRNAGRACQKKTLFVSFKDLRWQEWIIAPEGYSAFYCQGECSFPLNIHMNATNHAIVQTLVHLMNPFAVPKPSCAPTKLTPISVLYFDDSSNVILKKYKNMVVRACGCH